MQPTKWLEENDANLLSDLAKLVAVQSISTDGEHQHEIEQCAELVCEQMRAAGLQNVQTLKTGNSNPYAYGEWLGAPGKPTVFLYAHYDVQPVKGFEDDWLSPPWTLTERDGRLFGRGAADDKGAVTTQLGAIAAYLQTKGTLPVNVKMLVEGEEEVGSTNLQGFFQEHKERLMSDVIVVCDTENVEIGLPCITYSLRGIVELHVEVRSAAAPVHSGMAGGMLADAAIALNVILARLYWGHKKLPVPGLYDKVRKLTRAEKNAFRKIGGEEAKWRSDLEIADGVELALERNVHPNEATWRNPSITVIVQQASSVQAKSNQVLPSAQAYISCRIVPDQEPEEVYEQIKAVLMKDPPWGVNVNVKPTAQMKWWMTDPTGPAFTSAQKALKKGFGVKPVPIGCGGSIGFVGPLAELFDGAPALLLGIEDPQSKAHAPNESLHAGDFRKLTASLTHLFEQLGSLPDGQVKASEPEVSAAPAPTESPEPEASIPSQLDEVPASEAQEAPIGPG